MRTLKTLVVGVSGRGRWPLRVCRPEIGFHVTAVCDVNEDALKEARDVTDLPDAMLFKDYEKALDQSGAECVIICTPTTLHCPMAKQAIERGLPVLTEKGMAPDWDTARDMVDFVREKDGIFCVSQNYRYSAQERTISRILGDPTDPAFVGRVFMMDYTHHRVRPIPRTLNYPFACVWDMSCHHFDNLFSWFGAPEELTAHSFAATWSEYPHDANTSAFIRFGNGVCVNYFHGHDSGRGEFRLGIHGERGTVLGRVLDKTSSTHGLEKLSFMARPEEQFGVGDEADVPFEEGLNEAGVLADFHTYIENGREPGISGYQNLEVMAMCQMMVMSVEEKRTVKRAEL